MHCVNPKPQNPKSNTHREYPFWTNPDSTKKNGKDPYLVPKIMKYWVNIEWKLSEKKKGSAGKTFCQFRGSNQCAGSLIGYVPACFLHVF